MAAILLAATGALWAALGFALPAAQVRALVRRQVSSTFARDVRFTNATALLWPPVRLSVERPELAEPGGFGRGAAFRAQSIDLDLDLWALLQRRVVVRKLRIDRPAIHLVIRPDGSTNLDSLTRPEPARRETGDSMELDIRELAILNSRVLLDDIGKERRTVLSLGSRIALRAARGGASVTTSGETRVAGLKWGPLRALREADLGGGLENVEWRIVHRGSWEAARKRLQLDRLAVRFGATDLGVQGVIVDPGPRARLDLRAVGRNVELRDVLAQFAAADLGALKAQGSGRLDFDLAMRGAFGPERRPEITGILSLADGQLRYPNAPAAVRNVRLTAYFAPDSITIPRFDAWVAAADPRAGSAPLHGSLRLTRLSDPNVRFDVRGVAELGMIAPLLAASDVRLGGRAAVDVQGQGRVRDPGSVTLAGQARLLDVSVESPRLPKKVEHIQGQIQFAPARAAIQGLELQAGKSSLALDATVTRPLALLAKPGKVAPAGLDFSLRSPYLDLDEIVPQGGSAPVLPNASGHGTVAIGRLKSRKLDVRDVAAGVDVQPTQLEVASYSAKGYGGTVTGSARFQLADPANPVFGVKASLASMDANALLGEWTPARNWLHGSLGADIDFGGQGSTADRIKQSLNANGLAAVSNGAIGPGPALLAIAKATGIPAFQTIKFRDLKLPFRVQNGRMITDPVTLDGDYGRWQLVGGIGFDGNLDYAVSVTLPPEAAASVRAKSNTVARALADSSGNLLLDLRVSGPAVAPRVEWDLHATQDRLVGRLSKTLLDQRKKLEDQVRAEAEARQKSVADSARTAVRQIEKSTRDSLERRVKNVLEGFFQGSKPPPTIEAGKPEPLPAEPPKTETPAPADTTKP